MSDFVMSSRQAAELDHAFERNGWSSQEVKLLSSGDLLANVRQVILGHASITVMEHVIDCDADPFVPNSWKVEEHQKAGPFTWDAAKVEFHLANGQKNGKVIEGNKLRKELSDKLTLNANVLDYLLAHPHLIPEEWKGKAVFFWGTVYRNSDGSLFVRYLCWNDDRWLSDLYWLDFGWNGSRPALVRAS